MSKKIQFCLEKLIDSAFFLYAVNLKKSGSSQDIRGEDVRPLSPFFPRHSLQESLDDNENFPIRSTEVRMSHRKISSPLPSVKMIGSMRMRRRALSESPAEALISPVVPRRCLSPRELNKGVPRAISCPAITSDTNEQANQPTPSPPISPRYNFEDLALNDAESQTRTKFVTTPTRASSQLKSADQDRLPRINQTRCGSMLIRPHKAPTESARELFNVSPVLGQSADTTIDGHNSEIQCDVADKVQYFLHTLSVEEDIDQ